MYICMIRVKIYAKISTLLLRLERKIDNLAVSYIWKWYKAMEKDPRASEELLNSVHNDPAFKKIFERFENGQS